MVARKRRKIVAAFRDAGAVSEESAKTREDLGLRSSVIFRRLAKTGVLVDCGGDRYYLDEEAEARARHRRFLRFQLIVAVVVATFFVVWMLQLSR